MAQTISLSRPSASVLNGDCVQLMEAMPAESIDCILTDPPYLCNYRNHQGETLLNDDSNSDRKWLYDSAKQMYRVLKDHRFCISFYGYTQAADFYAAWKQAGFRVVGHLVWAKSWVSGTGYTARRHENAVLLAKGTPATPKAPPSDIMLAKYSHNNLHPTQKPVALLKEYLRAYAPENGLVLDPFAGSGSTLVAAKELGLNSIGFELDTKHSKIANIRLNKIS